VRGGELVTNANGETISGIANGVRIDTSTNGVGSATGSVQNYGVISGGVDIAGNGTVVNGKAGAGSYLINGGSSEGVDVAGTGSVGNYGSITGGVYLCGGTVTHGTGGGTGR